MPLSFSLVLLILGLALLWFSKQYSGKQWLGKMMISVGTVVLLVTSLPFASTALNSSLEREYPPLYSPPTDLQYVIVLGHGHRSDPYLPPRQQLSDASYYRVMEGLRLMQANPQATLVLSGYGGSDPVSNAHLAQVVASQYGVPDQQIQTFESAQDTGDEAALIVPLIQQQKSALVTSASHMPRALAFFHALGADPVPAPTYYLSKQPQNPLFFYERLPSAGNLGGFTVAWHEIIGSLWQKIRG